jgi:DNA polymerase elongation subunit (family B)
MVRIYFDIETFRERDEDAFVNEEIIAIGFIEDDTPYLKSSLKKDVKIKFFCRWDIKKGNPEKEIVRKFYNYLKELSKKDSIILVGFNILRFDIPLLIQKGLKYRIDDLPNLNKFWNNTLTVDYFQIKLPQNKMWFKGNSLENWVKNLPSELKIELFGNGEDIKEWYKKGEYKNIQKHLEWDLKATRVIDLYEYAPNDK